MSEQNSNSDNSTDGHSDHPKPRYDDVNIPVVVLLGILSAILTFVSICFVQGLYYQWEHSVVQADWNSRILTPQEQAIVDQKMIRDGFFETKSGEIYISVDAAAEKMLATHQSKENEKASPTPEVKQPNPDEKQNKSTQMKPEPPGPDPEKKDTPKKEEPAKQVAPKKAAPNKEEPKKEAKSKKDSQPEEKKS